MSFLHDLENVIDYVEEHLDGEIEIEKVAQKAACSSYHFQRMFSYLVGVSLSEYIRHRRMTLAAFELQQTDVKVIDLAVKYEYDSQSSFTRAFQSLQGTTPTCVRNEGVPIMAYPRLSFRILVKEVSSMQFRMEKTNAYQVFGKPIIPDWEDTGVEKWSDYANQVLENGSHDATNVAAGFPGLALEMISNDTWDINKVHLLHAIHFYNDGVKYFMYGWEVPANGVSGEFTVVDVPNTSWAIFSTNEKDQFAVIELYKYAYTNWFSSSGYEQAECPVIEKFIPQSSNEDVVTELWIPVIKK
ncbi:AraC family transcriptional regulator [Clostridium sp. UBA1056]|uniref:AraC family transcriptional regulator n=1 Tax=unclassified Clostridium TaxID=2614128 RepID=UPI0032177C4A